MSIDEKREKTLTNFGIYKNLKKITKSDHNIIECLFSFNVPRRRKSERKEIFKMRDLKGIKAFKESTENAPELIEYFKTEDTIKNQGKKWFKNVKNKMYETFERIRIGKKRKRVKTELDVKFEKRREIQKKIGVETDIRIKHKLEDDLDIINDDISKDCSEKHAKEIFEQIGQVSSLEGKLSRNDYWHLKQKVMPKVS